MKPGGISCKEVVELITGYLDGALDPDTRRRVEEHLAHCDPCVRFMAQIRATSRALAAVELEEHPDRAALLAAFRNFTHAAGS
jgi:anti-sigma factor RsiW